MFTLSYIGKALNMVWDQGVVGSNPTTPTLRKRYLLHINR
jgi:hypothetical protein